MEEKEFVVPTRALLLGHVGEEPPASLMLQQGRIHRHDVGHEGTVEFPSVGELDAAVDLDRAIRRGLDDEVELLPPLENERVRQVVGSVDDGLGLRPSLLLVDRQEGDVSPVRPDRQLLEKDVVCAVASQHKRIGPQAIPGGREEPEVLESRGKVPAPIEREIPLFEKQPLVHLPEEVAPRMPGEQSEERDTPHRSRAAGRCDRVRRLRPVAFDLDSIKKWLDAMGPQSA